MDWFHWIFSNGFAAFGVVVAAGISIFAATEWQWAWPRKPHEETTSAIRAGRVVHWTLAALAAGALALGIAIGMDMRSSDEAWVAAGIGAAAGATIALIGRGLRYILANE